ncbi:MAG TPA: ubiquinol-cytochrome c reductase iron-sulfur subunit [Gammaproteobacteria bacterium]
MDRRTLLSASTALLSGCAGFFASVPFVRSFLPSARAKGLANPVEVDLDNIPPGEVRAYSYRGATMLVLHRTPEMLEQVAETADLVLDATTIDPPYVDPTHRAIMPEFLVVRGVCTHLGCVPQIKREEGKQIVGAWWPGGFICPCHQSGFDYAGRVIRGPAGTNLPVPPHRFAGPTRLIIGEEAQPT